MRRILTALILPLLCSACLAGPVSAAPAKTVILVHGIHPVMDDLKPLERFFSDRGYRVIVYQYDSEQRLNDSATGLAERICGLNTDSPDMKSLLIVAHSMGGLVSHRALTEGFYQCAAAPSATVLLTAASPFGGFKSANNTAMMPVNILGIKPYMRDMGTKSKFITAPGSLPANVRHYMVFTDERGATLVRGGETISDDKVPQAAQRNTAVQSDGQMKGSVEIKAGHVGVINTDGNVSAPLAAILGRMTR